MNENPEENNQSTPSSARIKINDAMWLEITRAEFVGDLFDAPAGGSKSGTGNYAINLNREEIVSMQIQNTVPIVDKFNLGLL